MCKAFSAIVTRNKKVYWKLGIDGHNELVEEFKLKDKVRGKIIPIEITPKDYLRMKEPSEKNGWTFEFDDGCPNWWSPSFEKATWNACKEWYNQVIKLVNWKEARKPIHPFKLKIVRKVTIKQKVLLKKWDSVGNSVGDSVWNSMWNSVGNSVGNSVWNSVRNSVWNSVRNSVWNSVGDSVWKSVGNSVGDSVWNSMWNSVGNSVGDSVWDSVWGYTGSLFYLRRSQWKYTEKIKIKGYPFQCVVDLWKQGLVPSFDGSKWRLHSGKKAKIVFEISQKELRKMRWIK